MEDLTVKKKYGFVPRSVLYFTKDDKLTGYFSESHREESGNGSMITGKMSEFNSALAEFIIKYWSNAGDLVLDPFHGWGTRAVIACNLGRKYIGFDVSKIASDYVNNYFSNSIRLNNDKIKPEFYCADGCDISPILNNSVDLVFTCPPYFNIEKYESCNGQLTDLTNYDKFLLKMSNCFKRCYDVLKDSKYCVFVVGDWRVKGELKLFGKDIIDVALRQGFIMHDFLIHKLNSVAIVGCGNFDNSNFVCKSHEYVLVFKKAAGKKTHNLNVNAALDMLDSADKAKPTVPVNASQSAFPQVQPSVHDVVPLALTQSHNQLFFRRQI